MLNRTQAHRANMAFSRDTAPPPPVAPIARFDNHDPHRGQHRATTGDGGSALGRGITSGGIVEGATVRLTRGFVDSRQA